MKGDDLSRKYAEGRAAPDSEHCERPQNSTDWVGRIPAGEENQLDRSNPTPLHYQLNKLLMRQIEAGIWRPGDMIPTDHQLCRRFGISRSTCRQAILALVNDGYLRREKSKGTIVTSRADRLQFVGSLMSFSDEMKRRGIQHDTKVVEQTVMTGSPDVESKLGLSSGSKVYYLKRIRYVSGEPFIFDEHFIPYCLCSGIEHVYRDNQSLYGLLQNEYGFDLHHGQIQFEPVNSPSKEVTELLQIFPSTNLIFAERVVYSPMEVPLDYFRAFIHGKFRIDVARTVAHDTPK